MEKLINDKQSSIKALNCQNKELKQWISDSNMWNWVYSVFKINGVNVSKAAVVDMLNGTINESIPLHSYGYVQHLKSVYIDMQSEITMRAAPNLKQFKRWCNMLLGEETFRKRNPVVYEYGLIPCHFNSIEEKLEECFKVAERSENPPVARAVVLFLAVLSVYPFEEESTDAAFIMMVYCLLSFGLPIPEMPVGEEEFGKLITLYMDKGDGSEFYHMTERAVFNRLDTIEMLTKQAMENENN